MLFVPRQEVYEVDHVAVLDEHGNTTAERAYIVKPDAGGVIILEAGVFAGLFCRAEPFRESVQPEEPAQSPEPQPPAPQPSQVKAPPETRERVAGKPTPREAPIFDHLRSERMSMRELMVVTGLDEKFVSNVLQALRLKGLVERESTRVGSKWLVVGDPAPSAVATTPVRTPVALPSALQQMGEALAEKLVARPYKSPELIKLFKSEDRPQDIYNALQWLKERGRAHPAMTDEGQKWHKGPKPKEENHGIDA